MLLQLKVKNFKLIRDLDLDFSKGFNVITGETGAGKSMLLGALSLIMGERANKALLKSDSKIVVEATWLVSDSISKWFDGNDLDFEKHSIVRREISTSGKSRLFINDTPVLANTVKQFTDLVVDLHGQFESSAYLESKKQLQVLDDFAGIGLEVEGFRTEYLKLQNVKKELQETEASVQKLLLEKEFDDFVLNELLEAKLVENESIEGLEQEIEEAEKWTDFQQLYAQIEHLITAENGPQEIVSELLKNTERHLPVTDELTSLLLNVKEELSDVVLLANKRANNTSVDEEKIESLRVRLNELNALIYKHKCSDVEGLLSKISELKGKSHDFENSSERIVFLQKEILALEKTLTVKAGAISEKRNKAKLQFADEVGAIVNQLSMPNAALQVVVNDCELNEFGQNNVEWRVKTVKGADFEPLKKVASGGEISRILLAVKCVLAQKLTLPSLILDEADTGLSGQVAIEIGQLLKDMGLTMQIIGISHLPQVAAKANHHIKMFKSEDENTEVSDAKILNQTEREEEISEMLSGKKAGAEALNNARLLLS